MKNLVLVLIMLLLSQKYDAQNAFNSDSFKPYFAMDIEQVNIVFPPTVFDWQIDHSIFSLIEINFGENLSVPNSTQAGDFMFRFNYLSSLGAMIIYKYKEEKLLSIFVFENSPLVVFKNYVTITSQWNKQTALLENVNSYENRIYLFPKLLSVINIEEGILSDNISSEIQKKGLEKFQEIHPDHKVCEIDSTYWK